MCKQPSTCRWFSVAAVYEATAAVRVARAQMRKLEPSPLPPANDRGNLVTKIHLLKEHIPCDDARRLTFRRRSSINKDGAVGQTIVVSCLLPPRWSATFFEYFTKRKWEGHGGQIL